jgi:ribosomal protein S27AE
VTTRSWSDKRDTNSCPRCGSTFLDGEHEMGRECPRCELCMCPRCGASSSSGEEDECASYCERCHYATEVHACDYGGSGELEDFPLDDYVVLRPVYRCRDRFQMSDVLWLTGDSLKYEMRRVVRWKRNEDGTCDMEMELFSALGSHPAQLKAAHDQHMSSTGASWTWADQRTGDWEGGHP